MGVKKFGGEEEGKARLESAGCHEGMTGEVTSAIFVEEKRPPQ